MINIIKDNNGKKIKEPGEKLVIEFTDGSMIEAADYREAAATILGTEYLDCETAETEKDASLWLMRRLPP